MSKWTTDQLKAIELEGNNIIVSAGAGSGKTAVLTERVIRKLKSGININELLILTFTKAAANEMKERIRKAIKKNIDLKEQLDKIDSSYITTFDSFSLSVLKKYHYILNLSPSISICESSVISLKKEELMEEVFTELYEENNSNFSKLVQDFSLKDDLELRNNILNLNSKLEMRYDKNNYLEQYLKKFYDDDFINSSINKYEEILIEKIKEINLQIDLLSETIDSDYINKLTETISLLLNSKNYNSIKKYCNVKLPILPKNSSDETKNIKKEITKNLTELEKMCKYEDVECIKKEIILTKPYVNAIIEIIKRYDKKINKYKFDNDVYEFNDIAKKAIQIIDTNIDVANEIKNTFNEILLDEYQDTNDLQELFINKISKNNVYMVGDIKQSIYRFRNANPNLFKNKYETYKKNIYGIKIDLMKNFRSRREVLNSINKIFAPIMDNEIGGANYLDGHQMIFGNKSYEEIGNMNYNHNFELWEYDYSKDSEFKKEEIEIFFIANDIKKKIESKYQVFDKDNLIKRNVTYNDFVILIDRSKNFSLFKKIFEYVGIPLTILQDETLKNGYNFDIIKNILKLIIKNNEKNFDNDFKYSFISIARSYLFEYNDDEIFSYISNNNYSDSKIIKIIKEIDIKTNSNYSIIEQIIKKFDFYKNIIKIGNVEEEMIKLDYILDLTTNLSDLGYDIYDLTKYFEQISSKNIDIKFSLNLNKGNSVKIMTIHKSKGLEYHICYFPCLYEKFNTLETKERFCYDNDYNIIVPVNKNGFHNTIYKILFNNKLIKEEVSEKIRLFYVALTRAKEKIILISPSTQKNTICIKNDNVVHNLIRKKYTSFSDILSSIYDDIKEYTYEIDINNLNIDKNYNYIKKENFNKNINTINNKIKIKELSINNQKIEKLHYSKQNNILLNKENFNTLQIGKKIHYLLETIDFKSPNLDNLVIPSYYKEKIQKFLNLDMIKNCNKIYKEYEFIYTINNIKYHGIIDLLLEYDDHIKIVDYKLKDIDDLNYKKQLEGYKKYIYNLTNKNVEIYLYSIIDEKLKKLS